MKHLFVLNPSAGQYDRSQEMIARLADTLDPLGVAWEARVTDYPGHAVELARAAAETGESVRL